MKSFCQFIGRYFGIIAVLFLFLGLQFPAQFTWVVGKLGSLSILSLLLGIVMFGMGTTLNIKDFALVLKRPVDVFIGACAQFTIMPGLAYLLSVSFDLDPALTAGIILLGTCPGGTASNVITFMAKGDIALSVTMTSVSTILSPILTPFITYQIIGEKIAFDPVSMFWSIVQIIIFPIMLGLAVKTAFPKFAEAAMDYLPAISGTAISLIIAGIVAVSRESILQSSGIILLAVIMHNLFGYFLGFVLARFTGLSWKKAIALSIEVGMQNSALATGLAKVHFSAMPLATVPGAIASPMHSITGSILAWIFVNYLSPKFDSSLEEA